MRTLYAYVVSLSSAIALEGVIATPLHANNTRFIALQGSVHRQLRRGTAFLFVRAAYVSMRVFALRVVGGGGAELLCAYFAFKKAPERLFALSGHCGDERLSTCALGGQERS